MATLVTKTLGPGGDYETLAALAAANKDLVALDQYWVVTCSAFADTTMAGAITFAGWNLDATRYLHIKAAAKHGAAGSIKAAGYRFSVNAAYAIATGDLGANALLIFEGLQFKNASTNTGTPFSTSGASAGTIWRFINCVIDLADACFNLSDADATVELINCTAIARGRMCIYHAAGGLKIYHSTCVATTANQHCLYGAGGTGLTAKNSYFYAAGTGQALYNVASGTIVRCATDDTTSPDADTDSKAYSTDNFTNVTANSEDFHIPKTSALVDLGADLSAESAPYNCTTDIDGDPRDADDADIGADEYYVATGNPLFLIGF